ncbi:formylglycine-generating enzyme family protein [Vibrio alginolyticus]|uniref:formylglycine-generating enzyme family protein n=1 Tax=Vibrio alginolyticus TaxID=663 RepID=UPI00215DE8D0|nr:formylglycine-generating enzyme family protein [Vibrio alginolyticus]MCS0151521.1 formylglycine-generating enzyme family protein [Vibrio alginolyticus]
MKHSKSNTLYLGATISISLIITGCATTQPSPLAQKIDQDMVLIEGGQFMMGSDNPSANKSERPARTVRVEDFYLAKFEVTQELFESVTGSSLSYFRNPNTPVNNISWQQANYFIKKLNEKTGEHYRLPTEAEWEFAAKGGNLSQGFTYAGSDDINDVAWYASNSNNKAHKVGQKKPNELGLYDMTGNVGEFVIDAFDEGYYKSATSDNPVNAKDEKESLAHKSVRGGSFAYDADESENYRRDFASQSVIMSDMGLRLAKDAD